MTPEQRKEALRELEDYLNQQEHELKVLADSWKENVELQKKNLYKGVCMIAYNEGSYQLLTRRFV